MTGYVGLSVEYPVVAPTWVILRRYRDGNSLASLTVQRDEVADLIVELRRALARMERTT